MNLREMYECAIRKGIELDPRGRAEVEQYLLETKAEYEALSEEEKGTFDLERLSNPFGDTRIVYGDEEKEVRSMLVGISIGEQEILRADALKKEGKLDVIFSHHTSGLGYALASVRDTMWIQVHKMIDVGVPKDMAEKIVTVDIAAREARGRNYSNAELAEQFGIPLVAIHTPADYCYLKHIIRLVESEQPKNVGEIIELLSNLPENHAYKGKTGKGPKAILGSPKAELGKIYYSFEGGWSLSNAAFEAVAEAGVKTFIHVAFSDEKIKIARKYNMNLIDAVHDPHDSLGINLIIDALQEEGNTKFHIIPCSNFQRVER